MQSSNQSTPAALTGSFTGVPTTHSYDGPFGRARSRKRPKGDPQNGEFGKINQLQELPITPQSGTVI